MLTKKNITATTIDFSSCRSRFQLESTRLLNFFETEKQFSEEFTNSIQENYFSQIEENSNLESILNDRYEAEIELYFSFRYEASIVLAHTYLENCLLNICEHVVTSTKSKITLDIIKEGNYILGALTFLKLIAPIDKELLERYTPEISKVQKLRNSIVHGSIKGMKDGHVNNILRDFRDKIALNSHQDKFIVLTYDIAKRHLEKSLDLLNGILDNIETKEFYVPDIEPSNELPF